MSILKPVCVTFSSTDDLKPSLSSRWNITLPLLLLLWLRSVPPIPVNMQKAFQNHSILIQDFRESTIYSGTVVLRSPSNIYYQGQTWSWKWLICGKFTKLENLDSIYSLPKRTWTTVGNYYNIWIENAIPRADWVATETVSLINWSWAVKIISPLFSIFYCKRIAYIPL